MAWYNNIFNGNKPKTKQFKSIIMNSLEKLRNQQKKELQLLERGEQFLKGEPLRQLWEEQDKLKEQHLQEFKILLNS